MTLQFVVFEYRKKAGLFTFNAFNEQGEQNQITTNLEVVGTFPLLAESLVNDS